MMNLFLTDILPCIAATAREQSAGRGTPAEGFADESRMQLAASAVTQVHFESKVKKKIYRKNISNTYIYNSKKILRLK